MVGEMHYDKETIGRIIETAVLEDVISDFVNLSKSGSSLVGNCPHCRAKKFTVTPTKKVYKCFSGCDKSGKTALNFLMDVMGKSYIDALAYLGDRYNIRPDVQSPSSKTVNRKNRFRDEQLLQSGIPDKYQKFNIRKDTTTEIEIDRYQAATINYTTWEIIAGDDMVLHYLDIDGSIMMYSPSKGASKPKPLIRVRWSNPDLHKSKEGSPIKYQSAEYSGSHLWIPNWIITAYKQEQRIETLYITEGEKKADAMCLSGCPAVGLMGIHNWSNTSSMPHQFELIIKRCGVKRVVFLMDSDWQDISVRPGRSIDHRPNTFFKAAWKYREYFYGYITAGHNLKIYLGHVQNKAFKGVDDLIVRELKNEAKEILPAEFQKAMSPKDSPTAVHVACVDITEKSSYQIKELWNLHSTTAFLNAHREILKDLPGFEVGKIRWMWNEEEGQFDLAQKILPHEKFWVEDRSKEVTRYIFYYQGCLSFLANRGYGLYEHKPRSFRFVKIDNKVVEESDPMLIRHYMLDFTREIGEKNVLELLLKGGKQYLGPDNLSNLPRRDLRFNRAEKDSMYLYFKNCYWKITATGIQQRPLSDLPYFVWKDQLIDFEPKLLNKDMATLTKGENDAWKMELSKEFEECDMAAFYLATSNFFWKKSQEEAVAADGTPLIVVKDKQNQEPLSDEDQKHIAGSIASKMLAAGYMLHDYLDFSQMKAVICMDGNETEVGKSQGGTGKSIWAKQFEHLVPMEIIDGKRKNIEDDNHLYEEVDERTRVILFDDVRVNFNFEFLFSQITTGIVVNPKGEKRSKLQPPKFVIATNHALNGDDNSHNRRQYVITFSDFFNGSRTVADFFGRQLFHEWDYKQWNLFYNWMATCVRHYLQYGLAECTQDDMLRRRKLRQNIGENFLNWASLVFDNNTDAAGEWNGIFLNKRLEKTYLLEKYFDQFPRDRRFMDSGKLKEKLKQYCIYAGLDFNAPAAGGRIKSNGQEYFLLSDDKYDAAMYHPGINSDDDLGKWRTKNSSLLVGWMD